MCVRVKMVVLNSIVYEECTCVYKLYRNIIKFKDEWNEISEHMFGVFTTAREQKNLAEVIIQLQFFPSH